jgi:nucleoside-diphosphate-sugar epimerase
MSTADGGTSALIGHTGFVGSNLLRQRHFDDRYNSSNIDTIAGRRFDLVVCAGVRAEKWIANAQPERDREGIDRLLLALGAVDARRLVLISTVDVFPVPIDVDESTAIDSAGGQPYGINRRYLEIELASRFDTVVVRLPGLYGPGLKKNVIYDFLHDNQTQKIDSRGVFQFYGVDRLWADVAIALDAKLPIVHLATEPVSVADVAQHAFGLPFTNHVVSQPARYDLHTRYAALFGGTGHYIESRKQALGGIARFVEQSR